MGVVSALLLQYPHPPLVLLAHKHRSDEVDRKLKEAVEAAGIRMSGGRQWMRVQLGRK